MTSSDKPYLASKKAKSTLLGLGSTLAVFGGAVAVALAQPTATWFAGVAIFALASVAGICGYHVHRQGQIDMQSIAPNGAPGPG